MTPSRSSGYVHVRGTDIVDGSGTPLLLRGVGLGNWLLAEGYMWKFGDDMSSPRQIEGRVRDLVGAESAETFWRRFRDVFVTEADIARIAELGFDHVRLPINARGVLHDDGTFREDGFAYIDRAIEWCEKHDLWILLDLHGAPGGQTGTNIDDSEHGKPELFMDERFRAQTIALWQEIARRYKDRTSVLGYDLLNEPLPNEWQHIYADELIALYVDLTAAIREIDTDHLIMYEGSHWATNWSIFTSVIDPNSVLQFHRYWCPPEHSSIAEYLEVRDRLQLPIYMGEGGENTPEWIYTATRLYEQHGIGWNFWPWKKLDTLTSPVSAVRPDGWELVNDPAGTPPPEVADRILDAFLDNVALERCTPHPLVVNALFGRPPLHLPAWGYVEADPTAPTRFTIQTPADGSNGIWHHTAGELYAHDELMPVSLVAGQELEYPLESEPAGVQLDSSTPDAFETRWAGDRLVIRATATAQLRGLDVLEA
ncbi:glycoside hydrolase family 5 protein [Sanguibacter gelidistatuariae]|uniref:glycoside hydrolase family 5 protein n=1 Tax=Sanguibacter gelidistatuariae TaxID=1814289 RepID=UPI001FDF5081|nr:cellulase family glycosylhydrolase [Sanguibacter gelidistatuariae]